MSQQDPGYQHEGGRRYLTLGTGAYPLPNDEKEASRLDRQHELWRLTLDGALYISPGLNAPDRALDIGTGTGIWAIDFAHSSQSSQVIATDVSPAQQPTSTPANYTFKIENCEEDWSFRKEEFDFIHSRLLYFNMHDWKTYFRRCFEHLKPGGWLELHESEFPYVFADGSAGGSEDSALIRWSDHLVQAVGKGGVDPRPEEKFQAWLEEEGFVNVRRSEYQWAIGKWPEGEKERYMGTLSETNVSNALEGLSAMLLGKRLGWEKEKVNELVAEIREELEGGRKQVCRVVTVHCAQKPVKA